MSAHSERTVAALKRLRASQPFNHVATTMTRAVLRATGSRSAMVSKHLHRMGDVDDELPNGKRLRLWSRGDDWVSNHVFWHGWRSYEPETTPLFFRLASRARATVDVGAYVGFFTLLAGLANEAGRVYAFEPRHDAFGRLQSNLERNGLKNVRCFNGAVGERSGSAEFFTTKSMLPTSSSLSYEFMSGARDLEKVQVPLFAIDDVVRECGESEIDLVKIDTETTEPDVLRGMSELLRHNKPSIVCEVLAGRARTAELDSLLRPLGYHYYLLAPEGPRLQQHIEGHPQWGNFLFTPLEPHEVAVL